MANPLAGLAGALICWSYAQAPTANSSTFHQVSNTIRADCPPSRGGTARCRAGILHRLLRHIVIEPPSKRNARANGLNGMQANQGSPPPKARNAAIVFGAVRWIIKHQPACIVIATARIRPFRQWVWHAMTRGGTRFDRAAHQRKTDQDQTGSQTGSLAWLRLLILGGPASLPIRYYLEPET